MKKFGLPILFIQLSVSLAGFSAHALESPGHAERPHLGFTRKFARAALIAASSFSFAVGSMGSLQAETPTPDILPEVMRLAQSTGHHGSEKPTTSYEMTKAAIAVAKQAGREALAAQAENKPENGDRIAREKLRLLTAIRLLDSFTTYGGLSARQINHWKPALAEIDQMATELEL